MGTIEQTGLDSRYEMDQELGWLGWLRENPELADLPVPVYQCPSVVDPLGYSPRRDYFGVAGGRVAAAVGWRGDVFIDGVYYINSFTRSGEITDGLSNTMGMGESIHYSRWGAGPGYGHPLKGGPSGWVFGGDCTMDGNNGRGRIDSMSVSRILRSTKMPINSDAYPLLSTQANEVPFGSDHPGGAQFVFCDGHVAFLQDSIDMDVYQALSTRAGEEVLSGDY